MLTVSHWKYLFKHWTVSRICFFFWTLEIHAFPIIWPTVAAVRHLKLKPGGNAEECETQEQQWPLCYCPSASQLCYTVLDNIKSWWLLTASCAAELFVLCTYGSDQVMPTSASVCILVPVQLMGRVLWSASVYTLTHPCVLVWVCGSFLPLHLMIMMKRTIIINTI